ncbi:MAG TPA: hypothetical protein VMB18_09110 [Terriglobales bacterium]|jgi:hypothetical protein|nr:hypothetical protein [Terriglobales bacterium]
MELEEAVKIIRALADGVNPETGEVLQENSVCRAPQSVKALNRALGALTGQLEREKNRPQNAGKSWTRAEDEQVCEELKQGNDFAQIAKTHNRSVAAIVARLIKLGKIAPSKSSRMFPSQVA